MSKLTVSIIAISVVATALTVAANTRNKTDNKTINEAKLLAQGLSMGLEANMESPVGFKINKMIRTGGEGQPYKGVVIAQSGRAFKAECFIETMMGEAFCLPCDLQEVTKDDIK